MTLLEAKEAISLTLTDISKILTDAGLYAEVTHGLMGVDFDVTEDAPDTALIYGEISFGEEGKSERGLLECAVSAVDGEVAPEELRRELYDMRTEAKRIAEIKVSLSEGENIMKLLAEDSDENEENNSVEEADNPGKDNSKILKLIGIGIAAAVVIFTLVLMIIR